MAKPVLNPTLAQIVAGLDGGQSELAARVSDHAGRPGAVKQGHVWSWLHRTGRVPSQYLFAVAEIGGDRDLAVNLSNPALPTPAESAGT